ncbi:hypothetical protein GCM10027447_04290 [Glycomyces halotolerans]
MTDVLDELRRRIALARDTVDAVEWDGLPPVVGVGSPRESVSGIPDRVLELYSVFDGCEAFPLMEISGFQDAQNAFQAQIGDSPSEQALRDEVGIGTMTSSDLVTLSRSTGAVSVYSDDDFMYFEESGEPVEKRLFIPDPVEFFTDHLFGENYRRYVAPEEDADPDDSWLTLLRRAGLSD